MAELARVYATVRRDWLRIGAITLGFAAAAGLWAVTADKIYRVEVVLAPIAEKDLESSLSQLAGQVSGLASVLGLNLASGGNAEDVAIATLRSRKFAADFIREETLMPLLYESQWDASSKSWRESFLRGAPTLSRATDFFNNDVRSVVQDRKTGMVRLIVEWKDPVVASRWADKMVRRVNDELRRRAVLEAEQSIRYLKKEAEQTSIVGVEQAISRLIESQINRATLAKVREEYAFRVVDPASPPDPRDHVRPRAGIAIALGAAVGLTLGILAGLLGTRWTFRARA